MEDKVNYSLVGAFVLALGAGLVAAVLWLAADVGGRKQFDVYESILRESVAGLNVDAPVKYLGVDVGKVSRIGIDPENPRRVRLRLLIERGTPIKQDTEAVLKTQGLTGIAYVEINGGSAGSPPLVVGADGKIPLIPSKPSLVARLENVLGNVANSVDRVSTNLSAMLDTDNRAAVKQILTDLSALSGTLAQQQGVIKAVLADGARAAKQLAGASEQFAPTLARISASALAVEKMADEARAASKGAARAADAAASGVQQFAGQTLPEMERSLAELNQLVTAVRRLSEQTENNPTSLLLGGPAPRPGPGEPGAESMPTARTATTKALP